MKDWEVKIRNIQARTERHRYLQNVLCLCAMRWERIDFRSLLLLKKIISRLRQLTSNDRLIARAFNRNEWCIVNRPSDKDDVTANGKSSIGIVSRSGERRSMNEPVCARTIAAEKPQCYRLLSVQDCSLRTPISNAIERIWLNWYGNRFRWNSHRELVRHQVRMDHGDEEHN